MKSWIPLVTAVAGLGLPLSGCFVGVDHHHDDGVFTVDWTIDGATHPSDCDYYGATDVDISILARRGGEVDYAVVSCDHFGHDFYLPPGDYSATVTMIDSHGDDVSTTVATDSFPLDNGESQYVVADFPPDAFR